MTSTLEQIQYTVTQRRRDVDWKVMQRKVATDSVAALTAEVAALKAGIELHTQAAGLLNTIGDERQNAVQQQIEGIVTQGLQLVFGDELSFHLVSSVRSNAAQIDFIVRTTFPDGSTLDTPVMDARGGGVAAVVGFLLRFTLVMLTPGARKFLVLDEFAAQVSAEYEPRLAEFLRSIVDKTDAQILMITHSDAFGDVADRVYRFKLDAQGRTQVTKEA
jgi:DNA repair exonuclease SbcCD ATPase subunit